MGMGIGIGQFDSGEWLDRCLGAAAFPAHLDERHSPLMGCAAGLQR
jgi:hypothetical protein